MTNQPRLRLSPYYLNTRRLSALTGSQLPVEAQHSLTENSDRRVLGMARAESLADRILRSGRIPNLLQAIGDRDPTGERILGVLWDVFTFKGLSTALMRAAAGKTFSPASFSSHLVLGDDDLTVRGTLMNEHVFSDSSVNVLTGRRRMMIAGIFDFQGQAVDVHPFIIGELLESLGGDYEPGYAQSVRVYPQQIDAFAMIVDHPKPTLQEVRVVAGMAEEDVKTALTEIIAEPYKPKDWGGEKSDFVTPRLTINGQPLSAAFILKGRSVPGELHPAKMGKRGDQLLRVFDEPVDLVVIQHVNKIANTIVRYAEALAYNAKAPRRFCVIDGGDTAHILKTYGKLPS
jgi:hypothetical protein